MMKDLAEKRKAMVATSANMTVSMKKSMTAESLTKNSTAAMIRSGGMRNLSVLIAVAGPSGVLLAELPQDQGATVITVAG